MLYMRQVNRQNCTLIAECRNFLCTLSLGCKYLRLQSESIRKQMSIFFCLMLTQRKMRNRFRRIAAEKDYSLFCGPLYFMKGKPLQSRRKTRKKYSEELASDNFIECIAKNSKVTEQEIKYIFEFSCVSCVELLLG